MQPRCIPRSPNGPPPGASVSDPPLLIGGWKSQRLPFAESEGPDDFHTIPGFRAPGHGGAGCSASNSSTTLMSRGSTDLHRHDR